MMIQVVDVMGRKAHVSALHITSIRWEKRAGTHIDSALITTVRTVSNERFTTDTDADLLATQVSKLQMSRA